jgi:hypothetical protein
MSIVGWVSDDLGPPSESGDKEVNVNAVREAPVQPKLVRSEGLEIGRGWVLPCCPALQHCAEALRDKLDTCLYVSFGCHKSCEP